MSPEYPTCPSLGVAVLPALSAPVKSNVSTSAPPTKVKTIDPVEVSTTFSSKSAIIYGIAVATPVALSLGVEPVGSKSGAVSPATLKVKGISSVVALLVVIVTTSVWEPIAVGS